MAKQDVYSLVTDQILSKLEDGVVPWRKPWDASIGVPLSMSSRKPYRGVNVFLLGITAQEMGYRSAWWGTYKQIGELGGQVRKGEKSTLVIFWKRGKREVTDETTGQQVERSYCMLRYFNVFNADQADGLPERFHAPPKGHDMEPIEACEAIVAGYASGPSIDHGGARACYSPSLDHVQMPVREAFTTGEAYYSTLFHELTHSTGHKSRLNREGVVEGHSFGDELYSKEELIAEMGAAMLSGLAGIEQTTLDNSAAYLDSWVRTLKGDPKLVVQAAGAAQKAADLIAGVKYADEPERVPELV